MMEHKKEEIPYIKVRHGKPVFVDGIHIMATFEGDCVSGRLMYEEDGEPFFKTYLGLRHHSYGTDEEGRILIRVFSRSKQRKMTEW